MPIDWEDFTEFTLQVPTAVCTKCLARMPSLPTSISPDVTDRANGARVPDGWGKLQEADLCPDCVALVETALDEAGLKELGVTAKPKSKPEPEAIDAVASDEEVEVEAKA